MTLLNLCYSWICRNVAMILFGTLVTRAFSSRRINLDRDNDSLLKRLTTSEFFIRYPSLHAVLLSELEFSSREHLDDLPGRLFSGRTTRFSLTNATDVRSTQQSLFNSHDHFATTNAQSCSWRRWIALGRIHSTRSRVRQIAGVEGKSPSICLILHSY